MCFAMGYGVYLLKFEKDVHAINCVVCGLEFTQSTAKCQPKQIENRLICFFFQPQIFVDDDDNDGCFLQRNIKHTFGHNIFCVYILYIYARCETNAISFVRGIFARHRERRTPHIYSHRKSEKNVAPFQIDAMLMACSATRHIRDVGLTAKRQIARSAVSSQSLWSQAGGPHTFLFYYISTYI